MDIQTTSRRFVLFPSVLAQDVLKQLTGPVTTNDYKPDFSLIELSACSVEYFRDVLCEPIAERVGIPLITAAFDIDVPTADYALPGMDYNRACHEFVWHVLERHDSLNGLTLDPATVLAALLSA